MPLNVSAFAPKKVPAFSNVFLLLEIGVSKLKILYTESFHICFIFKLISYREHFSNMHCLSITKNDFYCYSTKDSIN